MKTLPDHPDSSPRISEELAQSIELAEQNELAEYLGRSRYIKDCCWVFVRYDGKVYCFLNEIGDWGWEVSEKCAVNYIEQ